MKDDSITCSDDSLLKLPDKSLKKQIFSFICKHSKNIHNSALYFNRQIFLVYNMIIKYIINACALRNYGFLDIFLYLKIYLIIIDKYNVFKMHQNVK